MMVAYLSLYTKCCKLNIWTAPVTTELALAYERKGSYHLISISAFTNEKVSRNILSAY